MEELLKVEHLVKSFGTNNVLKDIDFSVNKGDVISIIGSSGSGKSTLLRCINMLEDATGGNIYFHGKNVLKGEVNEDNYRTKVGMVFQSFNLFNNLVCQNLLVIFVKDEHEILKSFRISYSCSKQQGLIFSLSCYACFLFYLLCHINNLLQELH